MTVRTMLLSGAVAFGFGQNAAALTFNILQASGDTLTAAQLGAFQTAAAEWSTVFSDPITVNLAVGFKALGSGVLGQTGISYSTFSYTNVRNALAADAMGADDATAVAHLAASRPGQISLASAQAKALGGTVLATTDATIEFSTAYGFSTSRTNNTVASGTYDLIGVAAHEIGHALGFTSGIDNPPASTTVLDLFRYGASPTAYFSIDGGATSIQAFSNGASVDYQASHWVVNSPGIMAPTFSPGQVRDVTALDVRALDVLGYDLIAVPEPGTWALLGFGVVGLVWMRRRA